MTLGVAHELSLALAASLAFLLALSGGATSPFAWGVLLAPLISFFLKVRNRSASATSGTVLALASVGLGVATLAQRGSEAAVLAAAYALMGLLAARLLTRTTLGHDLQALLLSLLLVIAASVLNVTLSYAVLFVAYGVCVVWALITRELLRGAERASAGDERKLLALRARTDVITPSFLLTTSAVAVSLLLATSVLFVAFPRVGFRSIGFSMGKESRLPDSVSLRGLPRGAAGDDEVVARVTGVSYSAFERGLYLRGAVYDLIDEQGFSREERPPALPRRARRLANAPEDASYEVYLSPGTGTAVLTLGEVRGIRPTSGGRTNPNAHLYVGAPDERGEVHASDVVRAAFRYRVNGGVAAPGHIPVERRGRVRLSPEGDARVLFSLPDDLDPRVLELARQVAGGASDPVVIAERLRSFLLENFRYTLDQPSALAPKPLAAFLLEARAGHCEYFASAYALLLRANGIAARVIGGFQGGAWDATDDVVVFTGRNAHAWVEWFLPGAGWITDDPTPLATAPRAELEGFAAFFERIKRFWDDRVLDYALSDQRELMRGVQRALSSSSEAFSSESARTPVLVVVGGLTCAALLGLAWRRRARRGTASSASEDRLAALLLEVLARRKGRDIEGAETLREVMLSLPLLPSEEREALEDALVVYERRRFSPALVDAREVERVSAALEALRAHDVSAPLEAPASRR